MSCSAVMMYKYYDITIRSMPIAESKFIRKNWSAIQHLFGYSPFIYTYMYMLIGKQTLLISNHLALVRFVVIDMNDEVKTVHFFLRN